MDSNWTNLPDELRWMILENTNLVKKHYSYTDYRDFDNIVQITDGHLPQPRRHWECAAPLAFPRALFYVNRAMYDDVCEVFFSRNRFILKGDMAASRRFLENLPQSAARRIRMLDLELSFDDVAKMGDQLHTIPYAERRECAWHGLIGTIRERLDLSKLWLSVDAGKFRLNLFDARGHIFEFDSYVFLNEAWYQIFAPLRQLRKEVSGGLRMFHVFLAWDSKYETLAEKEIMGAAYNSAGDGKLPRRSRDYNEPHRLLQKHHQYRHKEIHKKSRGFDGLSQRHEISLAGGDVAHVWYREKPDEDDWFRSSGSESSWDLLPDEDDWFFDPGPLPRSWYRHPDSWNHWLGNPGTEAYDEMILIDADDFEEMTVWDPEMMCRRQKHGSEMSKIQTMVQEINLHLDEIDQTRRDINKILTS